MTVTRRAEIRFGKRIEHRVYVSDEEGRIYTFTTPEKLTDQAALDLAVASVAVVAEPEIEATVALGETLEATIAVAVAAHRERGEKTAYDDCTAALTKALDTLGIKKAVAVEPVEVER